MRVDLIVASSSGAVNGALIASGLSGDEIAKQWKGIRTRDVIGSRWQLLRLLTGAPSLFGNRRLRRSLEARLPVASFEQLRIPLTILATDLETGEAVALRSGSLVDAILASTALPGLFPPVQWEGRQLVDGGLSDNVPIDVVVEQGARRVIGMLCGCQNSLGNGASLISVLAQSFSLATNAKFRCDVRIYRCEVELHILEPCPGPELEPLDFDRAWTLIAPAYQHAYRELQKRFGRTTCSFR